MALFDNYRGQTVFITGDTGFKGAWLAHWLAELGAEVHGVGLVPEHPSSTFDLLGLGELIAHHTLDIRQAEELGAHVRAVGPQLVFHLAAQSLVRRSYTDPAGTFETNVVGTANVLDAVRSLHEPGRAPCGVVIITSDKCYANDESGTPHHEDDRLGGGDPYSASKAACEVLSDSYRTSFAVADGRQVMRIATARAGNVIGGGDRAEDRITPDAVEAFVSDTPLRVRNPSAMRPWQHVLEPLSGYLQLGAILTNGAADPGSACRAWNFGPGRRGECTVAELCDRLVTEWGAGQWVADAEMGAAREAHVLRLAIDRARDDLGWVPAWDLATTVANTVSWYRAASEFSSDLSAMRRVTSAQIAAYETAARSAGAVWARNA